MSGTAGAIMSVETAALDQPPLTRNLVPHFGHSCFAMAASAQERPRRFHSCTFAPVAPFTITTRCLAATGAWATRSGMVVSSTPEVASVPAFQSFELSIDPEAPISTSIDWDSTAVTLPRRVSTTIVLSHVAG
jgi:hypothetical protein